MKTFKLLSITAFIGLASIGSSSAQVSVSAQASATIITPISMSKVADLDFGNIATNGAIGTVVLSPAGGRTVTGGATVSTSTPGTVTAASFKVDGSVGYTYSIDLPTTPITITGPSAATMTVNNFTSTPSLTGTLTGGTQTILIGATLNLVASQANGIYTNASAFNVTVNYN